MSPEELAYVEADTVLDKIAAKIARGASIGDRHSVNLLLRLLDEDARNEDRTDDTQSGGRYGGEPPANSLSEGISEGIFESDTAAESDIVQQGD